MLGATWASRAARNPGLLVVLAMAVVSALATRRIGGSFGERLDNGLTGGETVGVRAGTATLWHAWLDGWHGAGLGSGGEQGPHLVVLAGLSWVAAHLPLFSAPASPVGAVVTMLVTLALPLATLTAYLGARVVTHSRLPRAIAALAWSTTAVLATAVGSGRLGGIVAAVLLPLVAAGVVLAGRRAGTTTATAATVLAAAVLGAFAPALLVLVIVAGVGVVLAGHGWARVRGLAIAVGPVLLLGPWVAALVERPALLFTGPGLSVWGTGQALPWQIALLHPGGPGSYPVLLSVPLVVAGLLGLLRSGRRGQAASVVAAVGLVGLAYAVAAPRIHLGVVPQGSPAAGQPITAWAGTGLLVLALALLGAALMGADGLAVSRSRGGWQALARWPVAGALVAAVLVSGGWLTWRSVGDQLKAWEDPRPAVAVDQAESGIGNRMLLLSPEGDGLTYQLLGREVSDVARSLPTPAAQRPSSATLAASISSLFAQGAAPAAVSPAAELSDQAIGFVGLRTDLTDPRIRALDATAGLSRLGEHDGVTFWRVLPGGGGTADDAVAPSRARLVTKTSDQAVPVSGSHSTLEVKSVVPQGASLVLAETSQWVRHARVTVDGQVLAPSGEGAAYALPAGPATISVEVLPSSSTWRYAQGTAPPARRLPRRAVRQPLLEEEAPVNLSASGMVRTALVTLAGAGIVIGAVHTQGALALGTDDGAGRDHPGRHGAGAQLRAGLSGAGAQGGPGRAGRRRLRARRGGSGSAASPQRHPAADDAWRTGAAEHAEGPDRHPVKARGATSVGDLASPAGVLVSATESMAAGVAAAQSWLVPSGDLRSLGGAACSQPGAEFWILAGGGDPGRQERLVLTNPGGNPVTVDATLHGPEGVVSSPNGKGILVPAHGRASFLLDSISGDLTSPVVHVVAEGGVVGAVVNDTWLDGARAGGSDDAVPAAAPSRDQVIPAVLVSGGTGLLRIAVPGSSEAVVQARVLTPDGPRALPGGGVFRMDGGTVRDIDLSKLPATNVGIQVRADVPVVAAAMVTRAQPGKAGDLAWTTSTPPITGVAGLPLAAPAGQTNGPIRRYLAVTVSGDTAGVEVITVDAKGVETSLRPNVGIDAAGIVEVTGAASVWVHRVSGTGAVRAGRHLDGAGRRGSAHHRHAAARRGPPHDVRRPA